MRGLDFNPNASNLLASGAADGETLVWDLTNPAAPNSFKVVRTTFQLRAKPSCIICCCAPVQMSRACRSCLCLRGNTSPNT